MTMNRNIVVIIIGAVLSTQTLTLVLQRGTSKFLRDYMVIFWNYGLLSFLILFSSELLAPPS